eukprot:6075076-Pleurochrysis_carterae.AAC.1
MWAGQQQKSIGQTVLWLLVETEPVKQWVTICPPWPPLLHAQHVKIAQQLESLQSALLTGLRLRLHVNALIR